METKEKLKKIQDKIEELINFIQTIKKPTLNFINDNELPNDDDDIDSELKFEIEDDIRRLILSNLYQLEINASDIEERYKKLKESDSQEKNAKELNNNVYDIIKQLKDKNKTSKSN